MYKPLRKIDIRWSPDFAYAIGLLASDGFLSNDRRHMGLKDADLELVENLKNALRLGNRIGYTIPKGNKVTRKHFYIYFGDIFFYRFLNSIGLTSGKSRTIKKVDLPDKFFNDFLRGLFDGDGTFYTFWDTRWPKSFVFHLAFSSASRNFIMWLKLKLSELYGVKGFVKKGDGVLNLTYHKGDSRKIYEVMYYKGVKIFLERKYTKIKAALENDEVLKLSRKSDILSASKAAVAQW